MSNLDLNSFKKLMSENERDYTELRIQENRDTQITILKGNISQNSRSSISGVSARVYRNGSWGFSSNPEISSESIQKVIRAAADNAQFLDSKEKKQKGELPITKAKSDNVFSTQKPRLKQKELIDFLKEIDCYILSKYPDLKSRVVGLGSLDMEKTVLTSADSWFHSLTPRSFVRCSLTTEKDGKPIALYNTFGGLGQFEDVFDKPSALFSQIDELYEHLSKKKEGVHADAGSKECILDAELAGILAHEAIGHTTEADLVLGGSVAAHYLNKEAASSLVTIVDYANTAFGSTCPIPVYVDDEGTPAQDVSIIENGILKGYMHSKESAKHFGVQPTGNARAYLFSDEPLIRMRNTAIVPGKSKLSEMIASIEDGYYLVRPSNGQADSTSEFMFGVPLGYEIKKGKIGRAILDTTISGVAFDVLKTVSMISDDIKWLSSGMCGKKQPMPVGMGGPAIKCKVSIGGR